MCPSLYQMLGAISGRVNDFEHALVWGQTALQMYEAAGDREGIYRACRDLAGAAYNKGDLDRAVEWDERALALARELGDQDGVTYLRYRLGISIAQRRDLNTGIGHLIGWIIKL